MSKNLQQMTALAAAQPGDLLYIVRGGNDYKINVEHLISNVGNGGQQDVTYSQLSSLYGAGNLVSGRTYFITDRDIYIRALSENQLEYWTVWLQRLPDYNNLTGNFIGVWQQSLTPSVGNLVAWNGFMYENLTGSNGMFNPVIDTTNWAFVPTNDSRYNIEYAALLYDFLSDTKLKVIDKRGNEISGHQIDLFRFGDNNLTFNSNFEDNYQFDFLNVLDATKVGIKKDWLYKEVDISRVEIINSYSSPVELLPPPGVNQYYDFKIISEYSYSTDFYKHDNGFLITNVFFIIRNNVWTIANIDQSYKLRFGNNNAYFNLNDNLVFTTDNQINVINGADGTVKIKIWYKIMTFG